MTDALRTVDAATLRTRLCETDDPAVARAIHVALEHKRGTDVATLAEQYGYPPDAIEETLRGVATGRVDGLGPSGTDADPVGGGSPSGTAVETVVDAAPLALVGLLADGTVSAWNEAAADLFGWRESEVLGRSVPFLTEVSRPEWRTLQDRVREGEVVTDAPLRLRTVDGANVDVSASAAPLDGASEYGMVVAFADETSRREREQRLEVLNRVLRHNVRNDLNIVLCAAEQALEQTDDPAVEDPIERVLSVARSLSALSDKARDVERVVEGRHPLRMVDVTDVLAAALRSVRQRFPAATFAVTAPDEELAYAIDGLPTAVENLLENAVVHHDGAAPRVVCRIETVRTADGRWVELTVDDDGPGIPEHEQEVVLEGSETDLTHGSGLGLWLVNWIVERSNGELRFAESDRGGASVTIRLLRADGTL